MYPKNAASPPSIAIGAVVQISDGAVQTSGVTVYHRTSGTTENSGGGTTSVGATTGTIYYTPTQAETNYESFELVAFKSGCIPACVTVVTTASATAGYAVCADTQKVDVNTIKTQTVTCAAGVTVLASVGTAATSTAQTGDTYALANGATGFTAIDTVVDAIKAKTDSLTFTVAGDVDCNIQSVGGAALSTSTAQIGVNVIQAAGTAWGSGAITAASIATGAIDADAIADNAIDAGAIASNAITDAKIATGAITSAKFAAGAIDAAAIANGAIDAATFAADVDAEVAAYIWNAATASYGGAGTYGQAVEDVLTDTAEIGTAGAGLSNIPWNASWDAQVESEVSDALNTYDPPTKAEMDAGHALLSTAAELAKVPKSDGSATWNATALGSIQSECTDALNAYDPPTKAELDTAVANVSVDEIQASAVADLFNTDSGTTYAAAVAGSAVKEIADNAGGSSLTLGDIADAVWDEAQSGHTDPGTFGKYLDAQVSTIGGGSLTAADIADAVWDEASTGHTDAGKAGAQMWTDIDAILDDTDLIDDGTSGLAKIATDVAAILVDTGTTLDTLVKDIPTNAELTTALATAWTVTTLAEDYHTAAATAATPAELLYTILSCVSQFAINSTTLTTYKLDGTTPSGTYTLDSSTAPTLRDRTT
jgi:hypothetical protein